MKTIERLCSTVFSVETLERMAKMDDLLFTESIARKALKIAPVLNTFLESNATILVAGAEIIYPIPNVSSWNNSNTHEKREIMSVLLEVLQQKGFRAYTLNHLDITISKEGNGRELREMQE